MAQAHLTHSFTAEVGSPAIQGTTAATVRPWFNYTSDDPTMSGLGDIELIVEEAPDGAGLDFRADCSAGPDADDSDWTVTQTDDPNKLTFSPDDGDYFGSTQFTVCFDVTGSPADGSHIRLGVFSNETQSALGEPVQSDLFLRFDNPPEPTILGVRTVDGAVNDPPDGVLDGVVVEFSEDVGPQTGTWDDTRLDWTVRDDGGTQLNLVEVVGPGVDSPAAGNETYLNISSGILGTGETPTVEYTGPTNGPDLVDREGESLQATSPDSVEARDVLPPIATDVLTKDLEPSKPDGRLDQIHVRFSEEVDISDTTPLNWTLSHGYGNDTDRPSSVSLFNDTTVRLTFDPLGDAGSFYDTDFRPWANYTGDTIQDFASTPNVAETFDGLSNDTARPVFRRVATLDKFDDQDNPNPDGQLDTIRVRFSEPVNDNALDTNDWEVGGIYNLAGVTSDTGLMCGGTADDANDACIYLELTQTGQTDTDETPLVTYDPTGNELGDLDDNTILNPPRSVPSEDKAKPIVADGRFPPEMLDTDGNGRLDAVEIAFSEPVKDSSLGSSEWTVEKNNQVLDVTNVATGEASNDALIVVRFQEQGNFDTGENGSYSISHDGGVRDLASNTAVAKGLLTEPVDAAPPTVRQARTRDTDDDGLLDRYQVRFSEEVEVTVTDASGWVVGGAEATSLSREQHDTINLEFGETTFRTADIPSLEYTADPASIQDPESNAMEAATVPGARRVDRAHPVITSVFGEQGSTSVEVTFSEPVEGSGPNDGIVSADLDYHDDSGDGASRITDVTHGALTDTATVELDAALGDSDLGDDRITATDNVRDDGGRSADPGRTTMQTVRRPGPFLIENPDGNIASDKVVLTFNVGVDDGTGGALTDTAFSLTPTSDPEGGPTQIVDVRHEAGSRIVTLVVDDPLTVADVSPPDHTRVVIDADSVFADGDAATAGGHDIIDEQRPRLSSARTVDAGPDGTVDWIRVDFTEPINDALQTNDWLVDGDNPAAVQTCRQSSCPSDTQMDRRIFLQVTIDGTGATPTLEYQGSGITDLSPEQNSLRKFKGVSVRDRAKPILTGTANAWDLDGDGWMDAYSVRFSEVLDRTTMAPAEWAVDGTVVRTILPEERPTSGFNVTFEERSSLGCGAATPGFDFVPVEGGVLADPAGNRIHDPGTITTDKSPLCQPPAPDTFKVLSAYTMDGQPNGLIDAVRVTLTQPIDDTNSTFDPANWTLEKPYGDSNGRPSAVNTGATPDDAILILEFAEEGTPGDDFDTQARPDVTYDRSDAIVCGPCDPEKTLEQEDLRADDGAGPYMPEALALDEDDDGLSDAYLLKFTENVDDSSFVPNEWVIQGHVIGGYVTRQVGDDDTSSLRFNQSAGDQEPDLTYTPTHEGFRDSFGNVMPAQDPAEQAQDDEPPSIPGPVTSPDFPPIDTGEWGPSNGTFMWGEATDNFGIEGYTTAVDGEPARDPAPANVTADNSTEVSGLSGGEHTFSVRAIDLVGNHGPARNYTFQVDADLPVAASISSSTHDAPPTCNQGTSADFSWSGASDPTSGLADTPYEYAIDDSAPASTSGTNATITGLDDGEHTFTVTTLDKAGNSNASSYRFFVDTQGPSVNITVPPVAGSSVPISWSGDDACSTVASYTAEVRRQGASSWTELASGSTTQVTFNPTAGDGGYEVRVRATDALGHQGGFETAQFVVDTSPPSPVSGLQASFSNATGVVQLSWEAATDDGSGVVGYNIYRSTQAESGYSKIVSQPTARLSFSDSTVQSNTLYYYRVRAVDGAGNEGDAAQASVRTRGGAVGEVPLCSGSTAAIESALGIELPSEGLRGTDEDGDRVPDGIANSDEVEIRSTPEIDGSRWVLLARPGEGPKAACVLATGQVETIRTVLGRIQASQARNDRTVVTITADKSDGWIEIEVDDPFPDKEVVKLETADGRQIPLSQLDRRDGKLRIVDDPETTYHVFYQGTEGADPAFPWLLVGGLMVGILVVLGAAVWYPSEQEDEGTGRR